jgi:ribonuclease E
MLIDATHPEETRVVVLSGNHLEEFDVEVESRRQLKGNIYLAKVIRVEPSLQAAFVDFGGNRHGFLSFNEIHPDYYQIPVADREALLAEQEAAEKADEAAKSADEDEDAPPGVETVGGDDSEEVEARRPLLSHRDYKIQEVVKRRQILLVQVVKEERGNKGAALTTYVSLAGRYCVLMPNTARGGGISRKIPTGADRKRLRTLLGDLGIPRGMAVIVRTAGAKRTKAEIKRDYEYLMRLWDSVRELTLKSTAPNLVHEEANLIKRSIRDLYSSDIEEIIVDGEEGYRTAKDFIKLLIPSHAKRVKHYDSDGVSLIQHFQVESQLDAMHNPQVQLDAGGYIVIDPTEALVAIDVNSGRATRGRNIEETALKTNLEAAAEIALQVRLRDLSGLIVIDFIDMEVARNNAQVERRLKESMRNDRARIQLGRISPFGLLELSRQRLRPSLVETSSQPCPYCAGTGVQRSTESTALYVLRALDEEATRRRSSQIIIHVPTAVAIYILNQKRVAMADIERRGNFSILVAADDSLIPPDYRIEQVTARRGRADADAPAPKAARSAAKPQAAGEEGEGKRRRRRRPRRRKRSEEGRELAAEAVTPDEPAEPAAEAQEAGGAPDEVRAEATPEKRRRRGRRGGRRRSRATPAQPVTAEERAADAGAAVPGESVVLETPPALVESAATPVDGEAAASGDGEEKPPARKTSGRQRADKGTTAGRRGAKGTRGRGRAKKKKTSAAGKGKAEPADTAAGAPSEDAQAADKPASRRRRTPRATESAATEAPAMAAVIARDAASEAPRKTEVINIGSDEGLVAARPRRSGWWQRPAK